MDALWLLEQVEAGGGRYVGIQERLVVGKPALILFDDPETGTTLSVPLPDLTAEAVRVRLAESRKLVTKGETA